MKLTYKSTTHAYYLDGKRCRGASSVAKVPDDPFALMQWKPRMALLGAAVQPTILTEVAACHDDKDALNRLVDKAIEHGKGTTGRDYGTAVHEIIRRHDEGGTLLPTPEVERLRATWVQLLASHDLEVVATEGAIVHPELKIAGRFDCVVRHRATGRHYVGDVKTGADADKYLHAHAIQLHVYGSAPLLAVGIPSGDVDFEATEFAPMHDVDQSVGLVFHLPMDGDPQVVPVDIAAGGECFRQVVLPTLAWRARRDLRAKWEATTRPDPHRHGRDFGTLETPKVTTPPDEGAEVGEAQLAPVRDRYKAINPAWINALRSDAIAAGADFHLNAAKTIRRLRIIDGLVTLCEAEAADDDLVKAIVRHVTGADAVQWPVTTAGAAVGSLTAVEAAAFVVTCEAVVAGRYALVVDEDVFGLQEVA